MKRPLIFVCMLLIAGIILNSCSKEALANNESVNASDIPELPDDITLTEDGVPVINVYIKEDKRTEKMDIETYLQGVLAGEMKNDWPIEALKAQAILARTYTLKFLDTKDSKYEGADISTDVTEAQAYNSNSINERIKQAVNETRGIVMVYEGGLPYAWFHAHSGGMTEMPSVALEYKDDPRYLAATASPESESAPEEVKHWTVSFSEADVAEACQACGVDPGATIKTVELGRQGKSGRSQSFIINGKEVSAPSFRINLGADKLKSTLIDSITVADGNVIFEGRGYGHGVGMSQWGAYALAEKGATAQTIVSRYFNGVRFVGLWE